MKELLNQLTDQQLDAVFNLVLLMTLQEHESRSACPPEEIESSVKGHQPYPHG